MKVKEFGAWPIRNSPNGGQKNSGGEYNKSFKGNAFLHVEEYASRNVDEYHHYPEVQDLTSEQGNERNGSSQSDKARKEKNASAKRQRMLQQVVGLVAGSVVVVSSYQSMTQRQEQQQHEIIEQPTSVVQIDDTDLTDVDKTVDQKDDDPAVDVTSIGEQTDGILTSWEWSDDKATVTLTFTDRNGNLIKKLPAEVAVIQKEATCNKEGSKTYTATVEDNGNTYSDSNTETLPPLGHDFDEGKEVILENGQTAMTFECSRCHEKFTFETSISENDD